MQELPNQRTKANDHLIKVLKQIHLRFEQKFKDYRLAFRNFDNDQSNNVDF